jgi:hypothetical protein
MIEHKMSGKRFGPGGLFYMFHKTLGINKIKLLENEWFWALGVAVIGFVSRLPVLLSPFLKIDEDECAAGLMALHALQAKELPFYFLGQSYGFAWLETVTTALAFKIFGVGVLPLKFAMLILWTIGCCVYYRAAAFLTNKTYAFLIMAMFVLSPTWMVWSMKARSGYLTAFLLSAVVIFWIARRERFPGPKTWAGLGALAGLIYYSQPSFAPAVFIFIVYALWVHKSRLGVASCLIGLISVVFLAKVMLLLQSNTDFWQPVIFGGPNDYALAGLRTRIYGALSQGSRDWSSRAIVMIWHWLFLAGCLLQAIDLLKKRSHPWAMLFFAPIILRLGSIRSSMGTGTCWRSVCTWPCGLELSILLGSRNMFYSK